MQERFSGATRRKVSHFILGEEGRVGSRSAFTAAAVVSVASLATMLLVAPNANAVGGWCNGGYCAPADYCCGCDPDFRGCSAVFLPGRCCS
ncbi:hypothetical protein FJZ33_01085 [Candidatus Poribacteria bacterium]|nr:hypothetical protein [Candidatus Poribacteria bacterium]